MITVRRVNEEVVNLKAEELIDDLELLKWQAGVKSFIITENFKKTGKRSYDVMNLQMEVEDGIIIFSDADDVILSRGSVLMGFLEESLLRISRINSQCYELRFPDGQVFIQGVQGN